MLYFMKETELYVEDEKLNADVAKTISKFNVHSEIYISNYVTAMKETSCRRVCLFTDNTTYPLLVEYLKNEFKGIAILME